MVATSFKIDTQWFAWPPVYFPDPPTLANYMNVWFGVQEYAETQYIQSLQKPLIALRNSHRHRVHLDVARGAVRLGDRLRRVALPHPLRDAHVPAAHAAHDSADRRRRAAVALLFGARPARHHVRADPDLLPHQPALRGVDDQELHRRGAARDRAGRRDPRRVALAHDVRDRAAADPLRARRDLPVHPDPDLERVPARVHHRPRPRR